LDQYWVYTEGVNDFSQGFWLTSDRAREKKTRRIMGRTVVRAGAVILADGRATSAMKTDTIGKGW
jgi:hypothetical protein